MFLNNNNNNNNKSHTITCHGETEGEQKCSSTLSLTLALDGVVVKVTPSATVHQE